jgi:hypothetical protein
MVKRVSKMRLMDVKTEKPRSGWNEAKHLDKTEPAAAARNTGAANLADSVR